MVDNLRILVLRIRYWLSFGYNHGPRTIGIIIPSDPPPPVLRILDEGVRYAHMADRQG
jgi:hypothetical protein